MSSFPEIFKAAHKRWVESWDLLIVWQVSGSSGQHPQGLWGMALRCAQGSERPPRPLACMPPDCTWPLPGDSNVPFAYDLFSFRGRYHTAKKGTTWESREEKRDANKQGNARPGPAQSALQVSCAPPVAGTSVAASHPHHIKSPSLKALYLKPVDSSHCTVYAFKCSCLNLA